MSALEKFLVETISLALQEPVVAAIMVIFYVHYSVRYGAIRERLEPIEGLIAVNIALAEQVDGVDEDLVAAEFNGGHDSSTYTVDDPPKKPWERGWEK